jgi:outer membrane protein assembly factor BamD (BamD/ComL family)
MKLFKLCLYPLSLLLTMACSEAAAAYTFQGGRLVNNNELPTMSVQEHYSAAVEAYQKKDWEELIHQATVITKNFPATPFANESLFYLGVGYFNLKEFETANKHLSTYLKRNATPKHFEEAIQYKFSIAERFQNGSKKRVMGWENMPKIVPAVEDAMEIYEEVITALPHDDLAAKALFGKAQLLFREEEYKSSVEAYQTIIRRFPKNSLAAESYIGIGEVYLTQCKKQYPDPDFLDLAEINLRKFRLDFPGEDRIVAAEKMLLDMQEVYAQSFYETGQFFERTKKPHASIIYYNKILTNYPGTHAAKLSEKRLSILDSKKKNKSPLEAVVQTTEQEKQTTDAHSEVSVKDDSEQAFMQAPIAEEIGGNPEPSQDRQEVIR